MGNFDSKIYFPTKQDFGTYSTRRYPKGQALPTPGTLPGPNDLSSNPLEVKRNFSQVTISPHGDTERWRYTVPLRRMAEVQDAMVDMLRDVAPGAAGGTSLTISLQRSGISENVRVVNAHIKDATVAARNAMIHSGILIMYEGDTIVCNSSDFSVGGSISYFATVHIIEYDSVQRAAQSGDTGGLTSAFIAPQRSSSPLIIRSETVPVGGSALWTNLGGGYWQRK